VLEDVYVDYRQHGAQMTVGSATRGFEEGLMVMALVDARYPELAPLTRMMRTALLYGQARRSALSGDLARALGYARSAAVASGLSGHVRLLRRMAAARWGSPATHPQSGRP
jgi:hypothetical protein